MKSVTVLAPAKLNLTLDITGVQDDGYHEMDMVMQAISLFEKVTIKKGKWITVTTSSSKLPTDKKNTAYQAAVAFFEEVGLLAGASIHIKKKTPVRAGMAGGSADAAAVLVGLNALYGARLSVDKLCEIGAKIGADVPFAIVGGTARVGGFGDKVQTLSPILGCKFVVVMPNYGISTPAAFAKYDICGAGKRPDTKSVLKAIETQDYELLCESVANSLEKASAGKDTEKICSLLKNAGADTALMTGSGAAVFGIFSDELTAADAVCKIKETYSQVWLVSSFPEGAFIESCE